MHTDEAVQAVKFGKLLEEGFYEYDPFEYHGPSLNYITLLPAWISGTSTFKDLTKVILRSVPVFFGLFLVWLAFLINKRLEILVAAIAVLLVGISPAMVFYSRYYIHELILVAFTYLSILSYTQVLEKRSIGWLLLLGISIGFMIITKETWVISLGMIGLSFVIFFRKHLRAYLLKPWKWLLVLSVVFAVVGLFFTSFFSHPNGLLDMVSTYSTYLERAGTNEIHGNPWYYYLQLLTYKPGDNKIWSEAVILIFTIMGYYFLFRNLKRNKEWNILRFIGIFSFLLLLVYSALPYKTPWNLLSFYYGFILISSFGIVHSLMSLKKNFPKFVLLLVLVAAGGHLLIQNFYEYEEPASPYNPWVYGHTSSDFEKVIEKIDSAAIDRETYIEVIFSGNDYWPFPWYLRRYNQVAYRSEVDFDSPNGEIILISPQVEGQLVEKIYERPKPGERHLYMNLFDDPQELRPGIYFYGYMKQELWIKNQNKLNDPENL